MSPDPFVIDVWRRLPKADRDAAYDNRAAVPAADRLIALRNEASRAMLDQFACHCDLPFGDGLREAWDIFPASSKDTPCFVFIHGGYWQGGDRKDFLACARGALEMGWSAGICGYPLAPEATIAQIVSKIWQALDWLSDKGRNHGASGRIVLCGWSAGAHLAAMAAHHPSVSATLCISGLFDLAPIRNTYLNENLSLTDDQIAELSPSLLSPLKKPISIAFGEAELPELRRQSCSFYRMRADSGMPGRLIPIDGANHFSVLDQLYGADTELARELLALAQLNS